MVGLVALLDDVAALARLAAASVDDVAAGAGRAAAKAAGVVVDDAAVTPQYMAGAAAARELPMIWRITKGSLRNKLVFILPALLLLDWLAPWILPWLLLAGGTYLSYEGAHKVWGKLTGHGHADDEEPAVERGPEAEDTVVRGAITTDFILSLEIMVISMNEVADLGFWMQAAVLAVVAVLPELIVPLLCCWYAFATPLPALWARYLGKPPAPAPGPDPQQVPVGLDPVDADRTQHRQVVRLLVVVEPAGDDLVGPGAARGGRGGIGQVGDAVHVGHRQRVPPVLPGTAGVGVGVEDDVLDPEPAQVVAR